MSMGTGFSRELLNAYVDGEADAWTSAEIAEAVANDPRLAAEVAALAQVRSASGLAFAAMAGPVPAIRALDAPRRPARARRTAWWAGGLVAACLALAAVLAPGLWLPGGAPDAERAWAARAAEAFAAWSGTRTQDARLGGAAGSAVLVAGLPRAIPDLSVARLSVAHLTVAQGEHGATMFVGYLGRNGCRLGYWSAPAPDGLPETLESRVRPDGMRVAHWRVGGMGFAALAHGMDADRFDAVTRILREDSRRGASPDIRVAGPVYRVPCVG